MCVTGYAWHCISKYVFSAPCLESSADQALRLPLASCWMSRRTALDSAPSGLLHVCDKAGHHMYVYAIGSDTSHRSLRHIMCANSLYGVVIGRE